MRLISTILFFFAILVNSGISQPLEFNKGFARNNFQIPFDLSSPDTLFTLSRQLYEISGLSMHPNGNLITINDEKGEYYILDPLSGKILEEYDFGKKDDYEAVATVDNILFIVESNGNIKKIDLLQNKKIDEFDTYLSGRNNVEGACYYPETNSLLLACKEEMENEDDYKRGVYSFNLANEKLDEKPFVVLDLREQIQELKPYKLSNNIIIRLNTSQRIRSFAPSAIDIDPCNGDIYILSSRGRLLVVLNYLKELEAVYFLHHRYFGQPEGLTFDRDGNMYISNEARSRKANLQFFERH